MKKLLMTILLSISPILADCDWNDDGTLNVIDVVETVDCILNACWDGSQCDWNADGTLNVIDVVETVDCILTGCWSSGGGTVTDIDGNIYDTVFIGDQEWMAENLKVNHYNNGDPIPNDLTNYEWSFQYDEPYGASAVYPFNADNESLTVCNGDCYGVFGNLYNWYAVDDLRGVCPEDFHVPTDEEWMELEMTLGMSYDDAHLGGWRGTDQGAQLAGNPDFWWSLVYGNAIVDDPTFGSSGFLALPGGYRYFAGNYANMRLSVFFWTSSESAWYRQMDSYETRIVRSSQNPRNGYSVRCVGD